MYLPRPGSAPVRREPLFLFEKKEGGKKTPEGERGRFPLRTTPSVRPRRRRGTSVSRGAYPYWGKISAAEERFWSGASGNAQLRLPSGESTQFTTRLTGYLIGSSHCLWPAAPVQSLRLPNQPVGAYFEGAPGEPSPGPFFPTAFLRKRKRCPRRVGALPAGQARSPLIFHISEQNFLDSRQTPPSCDLIRTKVQE